MKRIVYLMMVLLVTGALSLAAEVKFSGFAHTWFTYGQTDEEGDAYGFNLRRIRFKPSGNFNEKISWVLQASWDRRTPGILDAYLDYQFSASFALRLGLFTAPGSISGTLSSTTKMDFLERPLITEKWGSHAGFSSFRAVGIQAHGKVLNEKLYYAVMLANPTAAGLMTSGITSSEYTHDSNGINFWGRLEAALTRQIRVGGFWGSGKETDTDLERSSYGAHFYVETDSVKFKTEYIAGKYDVSGVDVSYYGMYAILGYTKNKFEPMIRYGLYAPNKNSADTLGVETYRDLTFGINYFHDKNIKIQLNYLLRDENMVAGFDTLKNNLFYINWQFTY